ncbi:hypothetical protein [Aquidulcibacter sp.]|uniref:hypothetical protein n=1 Tax=Aquidulcibacter sp. TaxID=2052990 RepID=UPI0025BCC1FF|nr:hypothetical protein [Aquidulcibacter sp.]MCA3696862.1 hypothetical protein [Aquidulcibacter sp.]
MERTKGALIAAGIATIFGLSAGIFHEPILKFLKLPSESVLNAAAYTGWSVVFVLFGIRLWSNRERIWPFK